MTVKPTILRLVVAVVVGMLGFAVFLFFYQQHMIYVPQRYPDDYLDQMPKNAVPLRFTTSQGEQTAFFLKPPAECRQLWILCGGNATTALGWLPYLHDISDPTLGFLLVDYPGYGACAGKPSRDAIMDNFRGAMEAWREHVGDAGAKARLNILGYSLGAATGLNYATTIEVDHVILIAPFTSLRDMAKVRVGWPWHWVLRQNFDNRARLAELTARSPRPTIKIIHDSGDETIPVAMSRSLAEEFKGKLVYTEIPGESHGVVVEHTGELIREATTKY